MKRAKTIATAAVTLAILFGLGLWALAAPDQAVSTAERRALAQVPEVSWDTVLSGAYMTGLETYFLDQFPLRDVFRTGNAAFRLYLLQQKDDHGIYLADGSAVKLEYPLKEDQVQYAADKIAAVRETYLQGMDVYYAVVPDKGYYAAEAGGYPHMDYDRMLEILEERLGAPCADLFSLLDLSDYYRTDAHWQQTSLLPVAQALADGMGLGASLTPEGGFTARTLSPFEGVYFSQTALPMEADALTYLTSPAIEAASMTSAETGNTMPVYTVERFSGGDGYDVFAGGAQAILTIESPLAKTDRELIVFRDSYGSSLAPLFLEGYRRVTLIDLRYVSSTVLDRFVTFEDQDVLFLYSTTLLNSGMLLR